MPHEYNKTLIPLAKKLRHNATRQEKRLWYDFLSTYPIRFQRQKTIGDYIVDFYCHSAKLIIELDGSQHYTTEGLEHDRIRTEFLSSLELHVLRFSNLDIDINFYGVCRAIDELVASFSKNEL